MIPIEGWGLQCFLYHSFYIKLLFGIPEFVCYFLIMVQSSSSYNLSPGSADPACTHVQVSLSSGNSPHRKSDVGRSLETLDVGCVGCVKAR